MPESVPTTSKWHWVMTVQTNTGDMNTREGVLTVPDGCSRGAIFEYLMKPLQEEYGSPLVVLFFDLQPNQL